MSNDAGQERARSLGGMHMGSRALHMLVRADDECWCMRLCQASTGIHISKSA